MDVLPVHLLALTSHSTNSVFSTVHGNDVSPSRTIPWHLIATKKQPGIVHSLSFLNREISVYVVNLSLTHLNNTLQMHQHALGAMQEKKIFHQLVSRYDVDPVVELLYAAIIQLFPSQNSIRHNLSLHSRFVRIQNEGTGKSSWWMLNPEGGKNGKSPRRRAASMDNNSKLSKSRGRAMKKKVQCPLTAYELTYTF